MTPTRIRSRCLPALAVLAMAGLVSACGGTASNGEASKRPDQILGDAQAASAGARSVRVSGSITSGGSPIKIDLVAGKGAGGGTVTPDGATLQVALAQDTVYLMGDQATMSRLGATGTTNLPPDKWLRDSASDQGVANVVRLLDITTLLQIAPQGALSKARTTSFNHASVIPLVDNGGGATLYVAATGKPYLLGIKTGQGGAGTVLFTDYGTAKVPAAPTDSVDLRQLLTPR